MKRCGPSPAPARWWSIRTMATSWRWLLSHHSTRILSSRASRRKIGQRCRKTRAIRWSIARSAACRQARHSSSSRTRRIARDEKSRKRALQLRWRCELRRPLFPMLDSEKSITRTEPSDLPMRSRFRATRFSISTETPLGFSRLTRLARCWESANNRACNWQANRLAICRDRSGCGFTIRRRDGRKRKRPMFRSARAIHLFRHCNWRWPTSTIANGGVCYYPRLVDKVLNQDGSPVLDEQGQSGSATATSAIGFAAGNFA